MVNLGGQQRKGANDRVIERLWSGFVTQLKDSLFKPLEFCQTAAHIKAIYRQNHPQVQLYQRLGRLPWQQGPNRSPHFLPSHGKKRTRKSKQLRQHGTPGKIPR